MNASGLWTAYEAAAATGGQLCARGGDPGRWIAEEWTAAGVSIDSRTIEKGEIFVALHDARDGHEFVAGAFARGASAALVARAPDNTPAGAPLLVVADTLIALRDLALAARQRNFAKRIAVTGSVGKTTTKEMLRVALSAAGRVHASDKSYNNHWGVPLTLARLPIDADFGVFEIGMNHAGEITPLTSLVAPHVAIVTTIGDAHIEFFGSRDKIAEAKAEIFIGLSRGGTAVLPRDVPEFGILEERALAAGARIVTFGEHPAADFCLVGTDSDGLRQSVRARAFGEALSFVLGAPGRHNAANALSVIAAAESIGIPRPLAAAALGAFGAGEGRGKQTRLTLPGDRQIVLVDESYNANPTSMRAALSLLGELRPQRGGARVAVLGDMLELGPAGPAMHVGLSEALVASAVERLYVAGALMRGLFEVAPASMRAGVADAAAALAGTVVAELKDGDIVMVKGSNGSRVSVIAAAIRAAGAEN